MNIKIKNKIFIFAIAFILFFVIACSNKTSPTTAQGYVIKEKEGCPFECCISGDYQFKECAQDYECKGTKCVPLDSDGDGLTDIEEKQIGTNLRLADTDNDGLTDYQEAKIYLTNPTNTNTDSDRYSDSEEIKLGKNPLVKNSPNIVYKINQNGEWNWKNIAIITTASIGGSMFTGPAVTGILTTLGLANLEVYKSNVDIYFENVGDDYTKWVNYDVDFYVDGKLIHKIPDAMGEINEKSRSLSKYYSVSLTALQTAGQLLNILNKKAIVQANIENIEYEKP